MLSEIKKLVSNKAKSNPVNCDISPDSFNRHIINITMNLDDKIQMKPGAFLWKGPRSCYEIKSQHISYSDIQYYFDALANKHGNDILDMDVKLLKLASPVISKSFESVVNSSIENGIVHGGWKRARVTQVYKNECEINDQNITMTS